MLVFPQGGSYIAWKRFRNAKTDSSHLYFKELKVSKHYFDINSTERGSLCQSTQIIEPVHEKTNNLGYDQV